MQPNPETFWNILRHDVFMGAKIDFKENLHHQLPT